MLISTNLRRYPGRKSGVRLPTDAYNGLRSRREQGPRSRLQRAMNESGGTYRYRELMFALFYQQLKDEKGPRRVSITLFS